MHLCYKFVNIGVYIFGLTFQISASNRSQRMRLKAFYGGENELRSLSGVTGKFTCAVHLLYCSPWITDFLPTRATAHCPAKTCCVSSVLDLTVSVQSVSHCTFWKHYVQAIWNTYWVLEGNILVQSFNKASHSCPRAVVYFLCVLSSVSMLCCELIAGGITSALSASLSSWQ